MNSLDLSGKKIFVSGGSRGIGAAIVTYLAQQNAQVAFTYSSNESLAHELVKTLPGSNHFCLKLDIADEASVETCVSEVLQKWTTVDGVVNNAGITKDQLLLRMKSEDFLNVIQTNLAGAFFVTKAFSKSMV